MDHLGLTSCFDVTRLLSYLSEVDIRGGDQTSYAPSSPVKENDHLPIARPSEAVSPSLWNSLDREMFTNNNVFLFGRSHVERSEREKRTESDFSKNGIESELDEFDWYQTRLRSLGVDGPAARASAVAGEKRARMTPIARASKNTVCVFCKNNGETLSVYGTHVLKDTAGRVTCPILRRYTCPICGASGGSAHTIKYCPLNVGPDNCPVTKPQRNGNFPGKRRLSP